MFPVNFVQPITKFDANAKLLARTYTNKSDCIFACEYVFEYLSVVTQHDIDAIFKDETPENRQAILRAIRATKFEYPKSGSKVAANATLMKVTGHPLAVEFVGTIVSSVLSTMSAVATNSNALVQAARNTMDFNKTDQYSAKELQSFLQGLTVATEATFPDRASLQDQIATQPATQIIASFQKNVNFAGPKFKSKFFDLLADYAKQHPDILSGTNATKFRELLTTACDNRAFSYFGLRRGGPCTIPIIELAAVRGGFGSLANIASRLKLRYAQIPDTIPVVGTMAHAFIMMQTAVFKQALVEGKLDQLLAALDINKESYSAAKDANMYGGKADICDYISFCAYIRGIQDFEIAINKPLAKGIVLLIDTTDTMAGLRAAIRAAIDTGRPLDGVRLDTTPDKYIVEVAKLLDEAAKDRPDLFAHTRIFCTDGINLAGVQQIEELCKQNFITRPISYGIGSEVANTKPFVLDHSDMEAAAYIPDPTLTEKFCLQDQPEVDPQFNAVLAGNPYEGGHLPADLYAPNQGIVLHQLDKRYAKAGIKSVRNVTASLHFRQREDSQNYLVVAGTDMVIKFIKGFIHTDEFIDELKRCNIGFNEQQIQELYKNATDLKNRGLELEVAAVADGTELLPGCPIATVTGRPEDVLLVESFFTSVVGGMSAVATAAEQLISKTAALPTANRPKFYYAGLDQQRVLMPHTGYAAMIGGVLGATSYTMQHDCVPTHIPGINFDTFTQLSAAQRAQAQSVCVNFTGDVAKLITQLQQIGANQDKQIRGNFTPEHIEQICKAAAAKNIALNNLEFLVVAPLAAALNPKGLVYKITGVELALENDYAFQHVLKAAGANNVPGKKTSIPGLNPDSLVIRDQNGRAVAVVIIDLSLIPKEVKKDDAQQILQFVLKDHKLYFERKSGSVTESNTALLDPNSLTAEFMLRRANHTSDTCKAPTTLNPAAALQAAIHRHKDCYKWQIRDAPVYIESSLYEKTCGLLRNSANDAVPDSQQPRRPSLRG